MEGCRSWECIGEVLKVSLMDLKSEMDVGNGECRKIMS